MSELAANRHQTLVSAFSARSERSATAIRDLWELERGGALERPLRAIVPSYLHMHCNRVLRHWSAEKELMIVSALVKHYRSALARAGHLDRRVEPAGEGECPQHSEG